MSVTDEYWIPSVTQFSKKESKQIPPLSIQSAKTRQTQQKSVIKEKQPSIQQEKIQSIKIQQEHIESIKPSVKLQQNQSEKKLLQNQEQQINRPQSAQIQPPKAPQLRSNLLDWDIVYKDHRQNSNQNKIRSNMIDWDIQQKNHQKNVKEDYQPRGLFLEENQNVKKKQSNKYWLRTRVDTCAKIISANGIPLAYPYYNQPDRTYTTKEQKKQYELPVKEEKAQEAFGVVNKATDVKKQLCVYKPNAPRNTMGIKSFKAPYTNASKIQLGSDNFQCNYDKSKHYVTSTQYNIGGHHWNSKNLQKHSNNQINIERLQEHKKLLNK